MENENTRFNRITIDYLIENIDKCGIKIAEKVNIWENVQQSKHLIEKVKTLFTFVSAAWWNLWEQMFPLLSSSHSNVPRNWCPTFTFTLILICYRWFAWGLWNCKRQSQSISRLILLIWNAWLPTFQPSPHLSTQGFETPPIPPSFFQGEILTALIFDSQGKKVIFDDKSHAFMFYDFHLLATPKQCLLHKLGIDY